MRTNWIPRRVPFSSRSSPRSFDMRGGASSCPLSSDAPLLLVRLSCRPALLASCPSCGLSSGASVVSACYPFRFRSVLSSYRSALFLSLVSLVACRADGIGGRGDFRRSRCLPLVLSIWLACLARVAPRSCLLVLVALVVCGSWRSRCRLRFCLASFPLLASPRRRRVVVMG